LATVFTGNEAAHVTTYLSKLMREQEAYDVSLRQFVRVENANGYGVGLTYNLANQDLIDPATGDIKGVAETTRGKLYPLTQAYQAVTIERIKFGINTDWEVLYRGMHNNPQKIARLARQVLDLGIEKIILKLMKTAVNYAIPDTTVAGKMEFESTTLAKIANTQCGFGDLEPLRTRMWQTLRIPKRKLSDGSMGYVIYGTPSFMEPFKTDARFIHWNKNNYPEKMFHSSVGICHGFEFIESNWAGLAADTDAAEKLVTDAGTNNIPEALVFGDDPVAECLARREEFSVGWTNPPWNDDFVAAVIMFAEWAIPWGASSVTAGKTRIMHITSA